MHIYICIYICVFMYMCVYVRMYVCICICLYMYEYLFTNDLINFVFIYLTQFWTLEPLAQGHIVLLRYSYQSIVFSIRLLFPSRLNLFYNSPLTVPIIHLIYQIYVTAVKHIYIIIPKCACVYVCLCRFYLKTVNGNGLILFAT